MMMFDVASVAVNLVAVNVLVAYTRRNVYFIAWATVQLRALFVLFRTLLVATVLYCHVGQI